LDFFIVVFFFNKYKPFCRFLKMLLSSIIIVIRQMCTFTKPCYVFFYRAGKCCCSVVQVKRGVYSVCHVKCCAWFIMHRLGMLLAKELRSYKLIKILNDSNHSGPLMFGVQHCCTMKVWIRIICTKKKMAHICSIVLDDCIETTF